MNDRREKLIKSLNDGYTPEGEQVMLEILDNMTEPTKKPYIDPKTVDIKELIRPPKKVRFVHFRDNEFWYETEDGFLFPISLAEATASKVTFLAEDRAILFMRWIRKYVETFKE